VPARGGGPPEPPAAPDGAGQTLAGEGE
jgi:hypothetical protein